MSQIFSERRRSKLGIVVILASTYTLISFLYSLIAFVHPEPNVAFPEFTIPNLVVEIGLHFAFGFLAALPLIDLDLSLLAGAMAVLIDSDHFLGALGFSVDGRPDHSFLDVLVVAVVLFALARKLRMKKQDTVKILFIGAIALFSHLSYDILASYGTNFPLLIPVSFIQIYFSPDSWVFFEALAALIAFLAYYLSRRIVRISKSVKLPEISKSEAQASGAKN